MGNRNGATIMARWRRKYRKGTCQDCGWVRNVTRITWWVDGFKYILCAECIKPYRSEITTHNDDTDIYQRASV